jgi:hypothetical protein
LEAGKIPFSIFEVRCLNRFGKIFGNSKGRGPTCQWHSTTWARAHAITGHRLHPCCITGHCSGSSPPASMRHRLSLSLSLSLCLLHLKAKATCSPSTPFAISTEHTSSALLPFYIARKPPPGSCPIIGSLSRVHRHDTHAGEISHAPCFCSFLWTSDTPSLPCCILSRSWTWEVHDLVGFLTVTTVATTSLVREATRHRLALSSCHTLVLGNRTKASIRVSRMFKSHVRPTIW